MRNFPISIVSNTIIYTRAQQVISFLGAHWAHVENWSNLSELLLRIRLIESLSVNYRIEFLFQLIASQMLGNPS